MVDRRFLLILIAAVVCVGAGALLLQYHLGEPEEVMKWNLTLVGSGEEVVLSFDEVKALPYYEGYGGFFTTVGVVNGPYQCKGVLVEDLCQLVGGMSPASTLWISASDGYMMAFSLRQVEGDFRAYHPQSFREVPHGELKMILMYELDGSLLKDYDGKPLRIAIVSPQEGETVTEGHNWVKWVNRMEIRSPAVSGA